MLDGGPMKSCFKPAEGHLKVTSGSEGAGGVYACSGMAWLEYAATKPLTLEWMI